eukprot:CAMPEP_0115272110 /NCGR_PEP_ID=MMETSP0270-20121206/54452_1 /TAXON_ID=71861 /ORGANISM="Scrippsiella trochoidea, Strain CCMP3099" /LENGTH=47 /DNA_ID= /DNA_START= /DNA_END= /DNA_ORIENTATION=
MDQRNAMARTLLEYAASEKAMYGAPLVPENANDAYEAAPSESPGAPK